MTNTGGQIQAGTVEADVMADEAGDGYNVGPTNFTIPGFKDSGNDKYTKIYAKSTEQMTGGGSGGGSSHSISESDISGAKAKILADLNAQAKAHLQESLASGEIVLDDAMTSDEATYKTTAVSGQVADNFDVDAVMKTSAIVFKEADLKNLINRVIANSSSSKVDLESDAITFDFGKAQANFKMGTADVKVNGTNNISPSINIEKIKQDIAGKTNDDLEAYLRAYPDVEKVEINYWPPFITGKVPNLPSRIEITLDNQK
jgi:hypothetical protein